MTKRINVSLPDEDINFCKSRDLSPSKLLQERVSQIRDEQNPILIKNLKEERQHANNLQNKLNYMSEMLTNIGEKLTKEGG